MLCLLFCAFCISAVSAQDADQNKLDSFSAKLIASIRSGEKQRVTLVTDKSFFGQGEYVWFSAFITNTISQRLAGKSRFLFVDLVNDNDAIVKRLVLDAAGRQLNSRIQLPDSLPAGYYWLRAYTKNMAEHDTNNIGIAPIYVSGADGENRLIKPKKIAVKQDLIPVIEFFPEGNNIITGITSTVALRATFNGEPLHIEGMVKDNREVVATKCTTNANGLGKFEFEPNGFRQYRLIINWGGKDTSYPLPRFNFFAGQLAVKKQRGEYNLRVLLADSIYRKDALSYVVGISRDSLVFAASGKGQYEINVDAEDLPPGIATFYLFDKNLKPLSERSIYVTAGLATANITTDKAVYTKRDKVTLDVTVNNAAQQALASVIAVSVSDSVFYSEDKCSTDNIAVKPNDINNIFLSSNNCIANDDIDLLMFSKTNTYSALAKNAAPVFKESDDSLLFIRGSITNDKKQPVAGMIVTLISSAGTNGVFTTDTTDNNGRFLFPVDFYTDNTQFAFEVKDYNNRTQYTANVLLDTIVFPAVKTPAALKQYAVTANRAALNRINVYNNLQNTFLGEHTLPPVTVKEIKKADYDETKRVSSYSVIIGPKELDGRTSVDLLLQRTSGLQLLNGFLIIRGLNAFKSPGPSSEPMLLVEGSQVVTVSSGETGTASPILSYLKGISPKDIEFIEILKDGNAANYGVRGANGVILVNLANKGRDMGVNNTGSMKTFSVKGVSKPVLFPITNYEVKNRQTEAQPDDRSTIFWNGNYITTNAGKATFSFYTSDVPTTYNITVKGVTVRGDIINKTITVKSR